VPEKPRLDTRLFYFAVA